MELTSPLIKRTEDLNSLPGALAKLGYHSVFDVVRVPRERFIRQHSNTLGRRAGKMYDLAIGYAHQVSHKFRHNRVTRAVNSALRGPFSKSGPDYASQFLDATVWKKRAPSGSPEANDGAVAYLTQIYERALQQEKAGASNYMNTLATRRPDIGNLVVDDTAINEVVPQIQLVNEILGSAIQGAKQLGDRNAVNTLLATTRYPNTLPFHFGNQQIRAAESAVGVSLAQAVMPLTYFLPQDFWSMQGTRVTSQANDLKRLQIMASGLAPEQQNIVVEPQLSPDKHSFYTNNYGADISNITQATTNFLDTLLHHTQLTADQVEALICRSANGKDATTSNITVSPNVSGVKAQSDLYGANFINRDNNGENISLVKDPGGMLWICGLTDESLDRINRIIRLQKWLDLSYDDVNQLITATIHAEADNTAFVTNDNTLRMLGVFKHYQSTYNVSPTQFAAWLHEVAPYALKPATPFFDQVFNSGNTFDTPFAIDDADFDYTSTSGKDGARVKKLCAALGLNHRQFLMFADQIAAQQGDAARRILNCNLVVVTAFYRLASIGRTLGMAPEDFYALVDLIDEGTGSIWKHMAGQPAVVLPKEDSKCSDDFLTVLQALSAVAQWLQARQLSARVMSLMTADGTLPKRGTYGTVSYPGQVERISVDWKDLVYDANSGELTLTQQIIFQGGKATQGGVTEFHCTLPTDLIRNGDMSWEGHQTIGTLNNQNYDGKLTDSPFTWDGEFFYIGPENTYVLNIPIKGTIKDLGKLFALTSEVRIHPGSQSDATFDFSYGEILSGMMAFSAQGSMDQLSLVQDVWQHLPNTFVDSTLLSHSGAKLVDTDGHAIDWLSHFVDDGLIDLNAGGLVTDAGISDVVSKRVNQQMLSDDDKKQAIVALTGVLAQAKQTQQGVATSLLAKALEVQQSLPALLLRWGQQTPYQWLTKTWALKGQVQVPADIPQAYLASLADVARRAVVCQQFAFSPAALNHMLDYPTHFALASTDTGNIDFWMLHMLSRYDDLLHAIAASGKSNEDDLLAYLLAVNGTTPLSESEAAEWLSSLLGWERDEALAAWKVLGHVAKTIPDLDTVMLLQQTQRETGLTVSQQQHAFALDRNSSYDAWQAVGQAMVAGANHVQSSN